LSHVEISASPLKTGPTGEGGLLLFKREVTLEKEFQAQFYQAEKMATVGALAAGVAHEINNPLAAISGFAEGLQRRDQIGLQINRCSTITQGLLKFARKTDSIVRKIIPHEMIGEIVAMVEHQANLDGITIHQEIDPKLAEIESDPAQLQQVFLNLLNNTIYAVKDIDGGQIRITSEVDDEFVFLSVGDNGCGIAPEQLKRIFVPFFTTKPVGKGTGLGLSTCYGIIENLGGNITVTSKLGVGSVFTVQLPISGSLKK